MTRLSTWLDGQPTRRTAPLFDTEPDGLTVRSHLRGKGGVRRTLTRHPEFDQAMIDIVEAGLQDPNWLGFLYVMHVGQGPTWRPLYVGKAERRGVKQEVSANLANIRTNLGFFGRWGYNSAYHVGELSHAVFGPEFQSYTGKPKKSYLRWADALFEDTNPPVLREPVHVTLLPWTVDSRGPAGFISSVAATEYELIALASEFPTLLNTQGR